MFCPDCGRESTDSERFCPDCGYPLRELVNQLESEKDASVGWADRIVRRPEISQAEPVELVDSYSETGYDEEDERQGLRCLRCGVPISPGTLCPSCGEKLPSVGESDNYISHVLKSFFQIIFKPRLFALMLPYPTSGGTLQPYLYPGVFASIFVLTLPLNRPELWLEGDDTTRAIVPFILCFLVYIFLVPLIVYLTNLLIHGVAIILGTKGIFKRTVRATSALMIWFLIFGIIFNLIALGVYLVGPEGIAFDQYIVDVYAGWKMMGQYRIYIIIGIALIIGWLLGWMIAGLYRMSWWQIIIHMLATYIALYFWVWLFVLIGVPLELGGYI